MNISEPAAVEQQRAVPRGLFARSLACACLMLMALASRDLAALQLAVTFQPGEFTKEVPMPRVDDVYNVAMVTTPAYICFWPSIDEVRSNISGMSASLLTSKLAQMESVGTGDGGSIVRAMNESTGPGGNGVRLNFGGNNNPVPVWIPPSRTILSLPVLFSCVDIDTARVWVNELRRIIRAYLGMPPPT